MPVIDGISYTNDEYRDKFGDPGQGRPDYEARGYRDNYPNAVQDTPGHNYQTTPGYYPQSTPSGGGKTSSDPWAGVNLGNASREWAEDFIRRNPGDYSRIAGAYGANGNNPAGRPGGQPPPGVSSPWQSTFSDPLTKQYEQLLQAQLQMYQQQQQQMQQAVAAANARRAATEAAGKNLEGYVNERVTKLKGPAYTGSEQEVIRTQLLDPMERDRTASRQRALEQISARGFDPSSGIAQELFRDVDRAYDEQRTRAQGTIASRQIEEQRSREQEAQQLLQYLTMLPDAMARGDLDFVNYTQGLVSGPGQQGLTVGKLLADIPSDRLRDALATLGIAPNGGNTSAQLMQLLQNAQSQRYLQSQQSANAWSNIGRSFLP